MAVDFEDSIVYIEDNDLSDFRHLSPLPDSCPACSYSISPEYILWYEKGMFEKELLCGCPRNECGALFFAVYISTGGQYILDGLYPYDRTDEEFPNEITDLSPEFVKIYNQAHHAEQEKLDMICGVGYRKALEHLVKDYIISEHPTKEETVKGIHSITKCINEYIDDSDIKEMAERATWLGNDETHYVRKWEYKDIQDLKKLIDLTVFFISMKVKAKRYKEEMVR